MNTIYLLLIKTKTIKTLLVCQKYKFNDGFFFVTWRENKKRLIWDDWWTEEKNNNHENRINTSRTKRIQRSEWIQFSAMVFSLSINCSDAVSSLAGSSLDAVVSVVLPFVTFSASCSRSEKWVSLNFDVNRPLVNDFNYFSHMWVDSGKVNTKKPNNSWVCSKFIHQTGKISCERFVCNFICILSKSISSENYTEWLISNLVISIAIAFLFFWFRIGVFGFFRCFLGLFFCICQWLVAVCWTRFILTCFFFCSYYLFSSWFSDLTLYSFLLGEKLTWNWPRISICLFMLGLLCMKVQSNQCQTKYLKYYGYIASSINMQENRISKV